MATRNIKNTDTPLWSGAAGSLAVTIQGDATQPPEPGAAPIATAKFQVDGNNDIRLGAAGAVSMGVKAGMDSRIVAIFQENQGAGADLVTRFSLADTLTD